MPNPADVDARLSDALAKRLQSGGTNADNVSSQTAATGAGRAPTLTGLN